jgi:hypothetical protein
MLAIAGAALTFLRLSRPRVPAMLVLLVYGGVPALVTDTTLVSDLAGLSLGFRFPALGLPALDLRDLTLGVLVLASVRLLAADRGLMNLLGVLVGGVPMCRGAGGMAGHVRFGARLGGPASR